MPIALGAVARVQGRWTHLGPWTLGRAGVAVAWAGVAWTGFVEIVCGLSNQLAMAGFAALAAGLWLLWVLRARGRFLGPKVDLTRFETAWPGVGDDHHSR
jgi:hypothetical protein